MKPQRKRPSVTRRKMKCGCILRVIKREGRATRQLIARCKKHGGNRHQDIAILAGIVGYWVGYYHGKIMRDH